MYITFIKDNTIATAIDIFKTTNTIDIRINTSLFKLNSNITSIHKSLYYMGFGESIIAKSTKIIKELACKRSLITTSIQTN